MCLLCLQFREMHWHAKKKQKEKKRKRRKDFPAPLFWKGAEIKRRNRTDSFWNEQNKALFADRVPNMSFWWVSTLRHCEACQWLDLSKLQFCGKSKRQNRQTAACCRPDSRRRTRWWWWLSSSSTSSSSSFYQPRYSRPRDWGHPIKLKEAAQTLGYL